jgi:hypothetical protein
LAQAISGWKAAHPGAFAVAFLHWGLENSTCPSPQQRAEAQLLVDSGADAVIGHHPHVVQSIEIYQGKPVFYSIGNFVFDQTRLLQTLCLVPSISFGPHGVSAVRMFPFSIINRAPRAPEHRRENYFISHLRNLSPDVLLKNQQRCWYLELKPE